MEHVILNEYSELSVGVYVFCLKLFYFMMLKAEKLHNKQKNIMLFLTYFRVMLLCCLILYSPATHYFFLVVTDSVQLVYQSFSANNSCLATSAKEL